MRDKIQILIYNDTPIFRRNIIWSILYGPYNMTGNIGIDDGRWRRNVLAKSLRCW